MAGHTSEDTPADTPEDTPVDTPVAAQFPEQPYRDKSASPNSDDSDSGPTTTRPSNEPSEPPPEIDPSAGPIPPFFYDTTRFVPNPFPLPPPGTPGVNPFIGLPVPPQPGTGRRDPRAIILRSLHPPGGPSTRASAINRGYKIDQAKKGRKVTRTSAPRRPSTRRAIKQEPSNSPQAGSSTRPTSAPRDPSTGASPTGPVKDPPPPSGPSGKGKKTKRASNKPQRKPRPVKKAKPAPRRPRDAVVTGPARNTRGQKEKEGRKGKVEFGFGDLDRLERRRREEKKAEREKKRGA